MNYFSTRQTRRGFSLIELLIVVAIMGILSAIIYPNVSGSRAKARDTQRISDLAQLQLALQLFYDRCDSYPYNTDIADNTNCPSGINLGTFITSIPIDPTGYAYDYVKKNSSSPYTSYVLHARLEKVGNAAISKGLSAVPSWLSPSPFPCSNLSTAIDYCVSP